MQGHTVNYKTTKGKETRLISTQKTMFSDFHFVKHFLTRYLEDIETKSSRRETWMLLSAKYVDGLDKKALEIESKPTIMLLGCKLNKTLQFECEGEKKGKRHLQVDSLLTSYSNIHLPSSSTTKP